MGGESLKLCFKGEDCTAHVRDLGHPGLRWMVASERRISFSVPARMPLQDLSTHIHTNIHIQMGHLLSKQMNCHHHVEMTLLILWLKKKKEKKKTAAYLYFYFCKGYWNVSAAWYLMPQLKELELDLSIFNMCSISGIISILLYWLESNHLIMYY